MITEIAHTTELVTAVITSHLETGENFDGAIVLGVYPENELEIWMEARGVRTNINLADVNDFCKQLKRAALIAKAYSAPKDHS